MGQRHVPHRGFFWYPDYDDQPAAGTIVISNAQRAKAAFAALAAR
jgi:hypothetical protein